MICHPMKPMHAAAAPCRTARSVSSSARATRVGGATHRHAVMPSTAPSAVPQADKAAPQVATLQTIAKGVKGALLPASLSLALAMGSPMPAEAIGPQSLPLEVTGYTEIPCPEGISKDTKCITVTADVTNPAKKSAFNSEVFGKIRYKRTGESALYGDFAEASDAGKMTDVAEEIKPGKSSVSFLVKLGKEFSEEEPLDFVGLKARAYPGMRQDFRIMKPVTATEGDCPEAELGGECEEIPF